MRNIWVGDNRDIVKWSTLLHLADHHNVKHILQICFLNPHDFSPIVIDGKEFPVPAPVIQHFRNVNNVKNILSNTEISVFDEPFNNRAAYLSSVLNFISKHNGPKCVFLDPDTGLEPKNRVNKTHVTNAEAHNIWNTLENGDVLVIYQHKTNMMGLPWIPEKHLQMANAIVVNVSQVKIAKSEEIAHDVVFLYAVKA